MCIFKKVKKKKPLNVLCPYHFDSEKINYTQDENKILERLENMPASTLKIKNLSISAIKSIYAFS